MLYRKYSNFYSWKERAKPRFLEHWTQNEILQQVMALIIGQYDEIERSDTDLNEIWLPIKSSDTLVIQYRKWLDKYANNSPMFRGFSSHRNTAVSDDSSKPVTNVFQIHTRHCATCKKVYERAGIVQTVLLVTVAVLLPLLTVWRTSKKAFYLLFFYFPGIVALTATYFFRRKFQ